MVQKIKNLSIKTKIGSGFISLIVLTIIMVFIGYSSLKLTFHKTDISQEANHIAQLILDMRIDQVKFMRNGNKTKDKEVQDALTHIEDKIKMLKSRMDIEAEREKIDQVSQLVEDFKIAYNNYAESTYQQQNYRKLFVREENKIIKPLYQLSESQNKELRELIKNNNKISVIERKQQSIITIKEVIKYISEIGKQERNLIINFANEQKQEEYINNTLLYFNKAKEELKKLKDIFKEEIDINKADELLVALEIGRNAFNDLANSELKKDKAKATMVKSGDQVVAKIKELSKDKEVEIKKAVSSGINNLITISIIGMVIGITFSIVITKSITNPILQVMNFLKEMAQSGGDLTKRININSQDEVGRLGYWFNAFVEELHKIILQLKDSAEELSAYSEELSASSEEGNASIESTRQLIETMAANIQQISASAQEVTSIAQETNSQTESGNENITNTITSIQEINQAVKRAVKSINALEVDSQKIGKIVEMITNIAEQTNLLALNAAIEAARAGEHGQGFAVVADEIRNLAEETANATREISDLVNNIQDKTEVGFKAINQVDEKASEGEHIAKRTGEVFAKIADANKETSVHIEGTANSTQHLAEDTDHIMTSAEDIERMSAELSNSSQEIASMAEELQNLVSKFKV
jgi:methyl-accepting chemotaxis protein